MTRDTSMVLQVSAVTLGVRDMGRARIARLLLPAIMSLVMLLVMSLVETAARLGFAPDLVLAWLTSFAIGVVVAAPTAVLVAPLAQRLVVHRIGAPPRPLPRLPPISLRQTSRRQSNQMALQAILTRPNSATPW